MDPGIVVPKGGGSSSRDDLRSQAGQLVDELIQNGSLRPTSQMQPLATPLAGSPYSFQLAVPRLLRCLAKGDANAQELSAELLAERAHWIPSPDLNEFVVRALQVTLPKIDDPWVADHLLAGVLFASPQLSEANAKEISRVAGNHLRNEFSWPMRSTVSMGLLGDRMPNRHLQHVAKSICLVIEQYREALESGNPSIELQHPVNERMFQVATVSLFALRKVLGAYGPNGKPFSYGEDLRDECRNSIFAIESAVEREHYPELEAYYYLLFAAAIVEPAFSPAIEDSLEAIGGLIRGHKPVVTQVIERLTRGGGFLKDVLDLRDYYDPAKPDQGLLLVSALMDTIQWVDRGAHILSEGDALILYDDLSDLCRRIQEPFQAYFVLELQRSLQVQYPELLADRSE
jgi:hypothetical protein